MLSARLVWAQDIGLVLNELVDFPEVKVPTRRFSNPDEIGREDIEAAAAECRSLWGLGSGPIPDVALAVENAGVVLVREETGVSQIEGLSAWSEELGRPFVYLAADKDNGFRSRFDAAHELGHLCLHRGIERPTERERHNELERQAHQFAGAFLLPAESFTADVRLPVTLDSLLLMKQRWGVSVAAMIMRLEALGIIDSEEKTSLFKRRSSRWGSKSEPGDDSRKPERPRLLSRTIELVASSGVLPLEHIASHFGLSARDIEKLVGLPANYLDGAADVFELARLKPPRSGALDASEAGIAAKILPFAKRQ